MFFIQKEVLGLGGKYENHPAIRGDRADIAAPALAGWRIRDFDLKSQLPTPFCCDSYLRFAPGELHQARTANNVRKRSRRTSYYFCKFLATISAISNFHGVSGSSFAVSSVIIRMQNGQPVATVLAPVCFNSRYRFVLTRSVPFSSSFQNCPPPAPQQKLLLRRQVGSVNRAPVDWIGRGADRRHHYGGPNSRDRDRSRNHRRWQRA